MSVKEKEKENLKECFNKLITMDIKDIMLLDKNDDIKNIKFRKPVEFYKSKIYNSLEIDKLKPKLIFCESQYERNLWDFYRIYTSALRYSKSCGRTIKILVQDSVTSLYIGILCLSSDVLILTDRDKHIGWNKDIKQTNLNNIMNLSCCVPLQPFGFNMNGGKLLTALAFSKEVYDYYYKKYNTKLCGIITTSVYGKSVQYDRLPFIKLIGMTKGYGDMHIPNVVYNKCIEYCKKYKIDLLKFNNVSSGKLKKIIYILNEIGLDKTYLVHGQSRGIYFGYISKMSESYLKGEISDLNEINDVNLKNIRECYLWWKDRWACKRLENLIQTNRIKNEIVLYEYDETYDNQFNSYITLKDINETPLQKHRRLKQNENIELYRKQNKEYMQNYRNNKDTFELEDGSLLKKGYSDIYKITCLESKKSYIGKAIHVLNKKNPQKHGGFGRFKRHVLNNKTVLGKAIQKYNPEKFVIEILCVCKTEFEDEIEILLIKEYNTIVPNGYNIMYGGQGNNEMTHSDQHHFFGTTFSEEYKNKLKQAHKGEKHHFYGKSFNKEHKKNLGKSISVARRQYDDNQFMELLRMKLSCLKLEEITEQFREKTNTSVSRETISRIWNGKIQPVDKDIMKSDEYIKLIKFKRIKISSLRILNDTQIEEILLLKDSNKSTIVVSKEINIKYNLNIKPASISDIWNKKVLPSYQLRSLS
jgi:hypothetical protein